MSLDACFGIRKIVLDLCVIHRTPKRKRIEMNWILGTSQLKMKVLYTLEVFRGDERIRFGGEGKGDTWT